MTDQFTDDQVENIKEAFQLFDKVGDGKIAFNQAGKVMRAMGDCPTNEDVLKFLGNPSGEDMKIKRLTVDEFLPIFATTMNDGIKGSHGDFVEGLRVFDKDGNGTVMGAEIRHVLTALGEKLTAAEVDLIMESQEDKAGVIVYENLCKFLLEVN